MCIRDSTYPSAINAKGSFVITSECENPEALMRWADMHLSLIHI